MKIASFDVDAQKGFTPLCPNELPVPEGDAIVPALNQLAARAQLRIGSRMRTARRPPGSSTATRRCCAPCPWPMPT